MSLSNVKVALLLAPHPDDGEFGCGGTLKRLREEGVELWYIAFSPCKKSVPEGFDKDVLFHELRNAVKHLGIEEDKVMTLNFDVREFPKYRQEILEELIKIRRQLKPDLVLLPNSKDIHQDHHVIHEEGVRAFKHSKLLGYELPWNNFDMTTNFHFKLERRHITAKMTAISEYKSQGNRSYNDEEFFYGLAKVRGIQVNNDYAEAFELVRWFE